jgi:CDP-diacylglycerol--glycerol-3-phosphate 3-phosphatidyltransferase
MLTIPNLLSGVRFILVPILLMLAWSGHSAVFLGCLLLSLVTDAADGFIARYFHQASELGARLDSWADFLTSMALPFCAWWLRPEVIRQEWVMIGAGIVFYLLAIAVGFIKFRRLTSYHTWGAKVAAVLFAAAVVVMFAGGPGWIFRIVMPFIILTELEEIAMTVILSQPVDNVPSLWHAMRLCQPMKPESRTDQPEKVGTSEG